MQKPATPEEIEAHTLKLLSEIPTLTREQIESWDKVGRPMKKGEFAEMLKKNQDEPVTYSINPVCQKILKADLTASEKVTEMVNIYLLSYPDFTPPDDEDFMQHPSYLALYRPIKHWFCTQCGGNLKLWTLMLAAAKEWFPSKKETNPCHAFCVRFAIEECTWWDGRTEFQPVLKDFLNWRYGW